MTSQAPVVNHFPSRNTHRIGDPADKIADIDTIPVKHEPQVTEKPKTTPTIVNPIDTGEEIGLYCIKMLLELPFLISDQQDIYNRADAKYQDYLANLSIQALNVNLFTGKDGGSKPASNDKERDLAIAQVCSGDPKLMELAEDRNTALSKLQMYKNQFEATQLIAKLKIAESNLLTSKTN